VLITRLLAEEATKKAAPTGGTVRQRTRYAQLHFGTGADFTPQAQFGTNLVGALTHVRQTKVSWPFCIQVLRVDALSIVPDAQAELTYSVRDLRFDVIGPRVKVRIAQRLARNAVHLLAKDRMQVPRRALDRGAEDHRAPLAVLLREVFGQRR